MVRLSSLAATLVLTLSTAAGATTLDDIRELAQAGLGDELLVALVEADATVYDLTPSEILELRQAGVGERVVTAMLRNGRERLASPAPPPPVFAVPTPVVVPVVPIVVPVLPLHPIVPVGRFRDREPEPVYWGWGGKRRPDTWDEPRKEPHRR